ncbi:unnamed protein product, partial [Dicrocoelium dendriticum]
MTRKRRVNYGTVAKLEATEPNVYCTIYKSRKQINQTKNGIVRDSEMQFVNTKLPTGKQMDV